MYSLSECGFQAPVLILVEELGIENCGFNLKKV
jgi:hypothetical protein